MKNRFARFLGGGGEQIRTIDEHGVETIHQLDPAGNLRTTTTRDIVINPDGQTTIDIVEDNQTGERTRITTVPDSTAAGGYRTWNEVLQRSAAEVVREKLVNNAYLELGNLLGAIRGNDKAGKIISSAANDAVFEIRRVG